DSSKGKALLYSATADAFRDKETVLHSFATFEQLASIEGATLKAPDGEHDDRATSYSLACAAIATAPPPCSAPMVLHAGTSGARGHDPAGPWSVQDRFRGENGRFPWPG